MTYRWLTDLDQALRAGGVPYTEVPGPSSFDPTRAESWRNRGRPPSIGNFDPSGIVCHHTASPAGTTAQQELNVILRGNSQAPGPIAHFLVSRDARVWLVAAGRCNHAGSGKRPGLDNKCTDQNALNIGIEASNNGVGERWTDAMCEIYAKLVAALVRWYKFPLERVYLHATTGPPSGGCNSKIDPAGPWTRQPNITTQTWDLGTWRAFVNDHLNRVPPSPPPEEDTMGLAIYQPSDAVAAFVGWRDAHTGYFIDFEWLDSETYTSFKAAGVPIVAGSVYSMRNTTLIGPVPTGDAKHNWTGEEFKRWVPNKVP